MRIEFDDGSIIMIDEKQEEWTFKIARGKNDNSNGIWEYISMETNSDAPRNLDIINLGGELRKLAHYGTGYPHKYNEYEGGWKPL